MCMWDLSFQLTEATNVWLRLHIKVCDYYKIYCDMLMDFIFFTFIVLYWLYWETWRLPIALPTAYGPREALQNWGMSMNRYSTGYMWLYPGLHAMTIPWFDTNDFYFSGHIMSSFMFVLEYHRSGWRKWFYVALFVMVN